MRQEAEMEPSRFSIRCTVATWGGIVTTLVSLVACGGDGASPAAGTGGGGGAPNASGGSAVASGGSERTPAELTDPEIFQVLEHLNNSEVAQAKVALFRSQRSDVKSFAQMLNDDHSAAATQVTALAQKQAVTPMASGVSTTIQAKSRVLVDQLTGSPDQEFDALYIQTEVTAHDAALTLVEALHGGADDALLKSLIVDLTGVLSEHAAQAKALP